MLSRMLLHLHKAFFPVDTSFHRSFGFNETVRYMKDTPVPFTDIEHLNFLSSRFIQAARIIVCHI